MYNDTSKIRVTTKRVVSAAVPISLVLACFFGGLAIASAGVEYKLVDSEVVSEASITPDGDVIVDEAPIQQQVEAREKANASSIYYQALVFGAPLFLVVIIVSVLFFRYKKMRKK